MDTKCATQRMSRQNVETIFRHFPSMGFHCKVHKYLENQEDANKVQCDVDNGWNVSKSVEEIHDKKDIPVFLLISKSKWDPEKQPRPYCLVPLQIWDFAKSSQESLLKVEMRPLVMKTQ
jgi:hypothetical protein